MISQECIDFFNSKVQTESDLDSLISQLEESKEAQLFQINSFFYQPGQSNDEFQANLQNSFNSLKNSGCQLHEFIQSNFVQPDRKNLFSTLVSFYKDGHPDLYRHCMILRNATVAQAYIEKHCGNQIDRAISYIANIISMENPFDDDNFDSKQFCRNMVCLNEVTNSNPNYQTCKDIVNKCHSKILNCPFDNNNAFKHFDCFHQYILLPKSRPLLMKFFTDNFSKPYFDRSKSDLNTSGFLYKAYDVYKPHFLADYQVVRNQKENEAETVCQLLTPLLIKYLINVFNAQGIQPCETFPQLKGQELYNGSQKNLNNINITTFPGHKNTKTYENNLRLKNSINNYKTQFPELEKPFIDKLTEVDNYIYENLNAEIYRALEFRDFLAEGTEPIQLPNLKCNDAAFIKVASDKGVSAMNLIYKECPQLFNMDTSFAIKNLVDIINKNINSVPQKLGYDLSLGLLDRFYDLWIGSISGLSTILISLVSKRVERSDLKKMIDSCQRIRFAFFTTLLPDFDKKRYDDNTEYNDLEEQNENLKRIKIIKYLNNILVVDNMIDQLSPGKVVPLVSIFENPEKNQNLTVALNRVASKLVTT